MSLLPFLNADRPVQLLVESIVPTAENPLLRKQERRLSS